MTKRDAQESFRSQNLYQCAFLMCRGFKLADIEHNGQKATLIFEGKDVEQEAFKFFNGAKADAKLLTDSYRSLKDAVFSR